MGRVHLTATIPNVDPTYAYKRIAAFEEYPAHSSAVRGVQILDRTSDTVMSSWEVNFRRGILCWTERATFYPADNRINFEEIDGDVDEFAGHWQVIAVTDGAEVNFHVDFQVGIPTLEHILDPIAEDALIENISSIIVGLLGEKAVITARKGGDASWDS